MTLGKYGSALGFEREDPTLCTPSRLYGSSNIRGSESSSILVTLTTMLLKVVTVAYGSDASASVLLLKMHLAQTAEEDDPNLEVALAYTGIENVTSVLVTTSTTSLTPM